MLRVSFQINVRKLWMRATLWAENEAETVLLFFTLAQTPTTSVTFLLLCECFDFAQTQMTTAKNFRSESFGAISPFNQGFCVLCKLNCDAITKTQTRIAVVVLINFFFFWKWKEFWQLSNACFGLYKSYIERAFVCSK